MEVEESCVTFAFAGACFFPKVIIFPFPGERERLSETPAGTIVCEHRQVRAKPRRLFPAALNFGIAFLKNV